MRIGIIGDTHLGSTDYSRKRRADFSAAFRNALNVCRQRKAEVVCLLGDVFDLAATKRNIDAFAEILQEISEDLLALKTSGIPLVAIPGNHEFGRGREAGELSFESASPAEGFCCFTTSFKARRRFPSNSGRLIQRASGVSTGCSPATTMLAKQSDH